MITARPQVGPPEFQDVAGIGTWQCGTASRPRDPADHIGQGSLAEIIPEEMLKTHARCRLIQALFKQTAPVLPAAPAGATARG